MNAVLSISILVAGIGGSILIGMAINNLADEVQKLRVKLSDLNAQIERARR